MRIKDYLPALFVIIAATLWGVDGIVLTPKLYSLPVPLVVLINSFTVSVLLLPLLRRNRNELKTLTIKEYGGFILVALMGGVIGTLSITKALFYVNYANLSVAMLIQKLQPLFAILLAYLVLKEKPEKIFFIYAGFAIIGTYLMTFGLNLPNLNTGDKTPLSAMFALLAAAGFGASTVFSKKALQKVSFELGTYLRFFFTFLIMLIFTFVSGSFSSIQNITTGEITVFLIIALTTGAPAIFLYYYGLKKISASVSTICELAFPLTAILLEYFLRDNLLSPVQWVGVIILLFSIIRITGLGRKQIIK